MEQSEVIQNTSLDYDSEGDVLYISFGEKPQAADDSDVIEEGVIIRLKDGKIVGLTIPNVRKRVSIPSLDSVQTSVGASARIFGSILSSLWRRDQLVP